MCQSRIVGTCSKWEKDLPLVFHFVDFVFQVLTFQDQLIQPVVQLYPLGLNGCSLASFALDESIECGLYYVADIHTFE